MGPKYTTASFRGLFRSSVAMMCSTECISALVSRSPVLGCLKRRSKVITLPSCRDR